MVARCVGESRVTEYRIYRLDEQGRIISGHDAACASDEEARQRALASLCGSPHAEIWHGTRCLGQVSGPGAPACRLPPPPIRYRLVPTL